MPYQPTKARPSDEKNSEALAKIAVARHVVQAHIMPKMRLALGSGSTAEEFIKALAEVPEKRPELCIASSRKSLALARKLGLPVVENLNFVHKNLGATPPLELCIDGADEIDDQLRLIKGGGGCLLREKILAQSSRKMLVIAEKNKLKTQLGAFPLPVEIDHFAYQLTLRQVVELFEDVIQRKGNAKIRGGEKPNITDGGNLTLDCDWGEWHSKAATILAEKLNKIPGVIENGIFENDASLCILASCHQGKIVITEKNRESRK